MSVFALTAPKTVTGHNYQSTSINQQNENTVILIRCIIQGELCRMENWCIPWINLVVSVDTHCSPSEQHFPVEKSPKQYYSYKEHHGKVHRCHNMPYKLPFSLADWAISGSKMLQLWWWVWRTTWTACHEACGTYHITSSSYTISTEPVKMFLLNSATLNISLGWSEKASSPFTP